MKNKKRKIEKKRQFAIVTLLMDTGVVGVVKLSCAKL